MRRFRHHHPPLVKGWTDAKIVRHSAEHIVLQLGPGSRELRNRRFRSNLIVGYSDLDDDASHDEYPAAARIGLEEVWTLLAVKLV